VRSRYKHDMPISLQPLTEEEAEVVKRVGELGMGPLEPKAKPRQPYDELYLKQKASRDYWSRN
jgi:hypothetical protein